jgi:hypothetical protein
MIRLVAQPTRKESQKPYHSIQRGMIRRRPSPTEGRNPYMHPRFARQTAGCCVRTDNTRPRERTRRIQRRRMYRLDNQRPYHNSRSRAVGHREEDNHSRMEPHTKLGREEEALEVCVRTTTLRHTTTKKVHRHLHQSHVSRSVAQMTGTVLTSLPPWPATFLNKIHPRSARCAQSEREPWNETHFISSTVGSKSSRLRFMQRKIKKARTASTTAPPPTEHEMMMASLPPWLSPPPPPPEDDWSEAAAVGVESSVELDSVTCFVTVLVPPSVTAVWETTGVGGGAEVGGVVEVVGLATMKIDPNLSATSNTAPKN